MKNNDSKLPDISWVNHFQSPVPGFFHATYFSNSMQKEIGYAVYLPPSYQLGLSHRETSGKKSFPVIYWLHGKGGDESNGFNIRIPFMFHNAVIEEKIGPSIMVFPNCGSFSMFCDSHDGTIMGESIIIKELVPLIDATYKTVPGRHGRALQGFSMGGFGAVKLAFKFPDMFSSAVAIAGSFHDIESVSKNRPEVFERMFGNNAFHFQQNSPYILAGQNLDSIKNNISLKFINGSKDFTLGNNYKLNDCLDKLGIEYDFKLLDGFKHIPGPYYEAEGLNCFKFNMENFK